MTAQKDERPRWRSRAACRDRDGELFFPSAEAGPARAAQEAAAKAVCSGCPVRTECLDEALARIPYGIAGGLTEQERHQLRTTRTRTRTGSAGAGSRGAHRAPLRTSHPQQPLAGTRAAEGPRA
jgi:hypothetical protein